MAEKYPFYDITNDLFTTTAITATGATTLVAALGTGLSILVHQLRVVSLTVTTADVEISFNNSAGAAGHFYAAGTVIGELLNMDFASKPLILETNTALLVICSVGAASTPTLRVTARVSQLRRGAP